MGGVNSMCIPRTNPNYCRENHMTPRKIKGKTNALSHAFNIGDRPPDPPSTELLNINTASEEGLMTLPGVNRSVAQQIVKYRQQINGFKKVEDLAVCLGAAKLGVIRAEITVGKKQPSICDSPISYREPKLTRSASSNRLRVSVNDSNVFQLMKVPGLTQQLSENIVAYRDRKGLFKSLDELIKVKGINQPLLGAIRPYLVLNLLCNNGYNRAPDGKSKASSADSSSELSMRTLSGSQVDILTHFTPLTEKHVRPVVERYNFRRRGVPALRIASWNLQKFCREKASNPGVLEVVCMTILENGLSIIACQELAHRNSLHKVVAELNCPSMPSCKRWSGHRGLWKVSVSDGPVGMMSQSMEYNAFIYDTSRGISCESLEMLSSGGSGDFFKRPLLGYFRVDHIELVFACVHLAETEVDNVKSGSRKVALTVSSLTAALRRHLLDERNVIVGGDFDLSPSDDECKGFETAGYVNAIPESKSTNISREDLEGNMCCDNIWFNKQAQRLYTGHSGVIRQGLSHPFIPDNWSWGGLVSDHCPVWSEIIIDTESAHSSPDLSLTPRNTERNMRVNTDLDSSRVSTQNGLPLDDGSDTDATLSDDCS